MSAFRAGRMVLGIVVAAMGGATALGQEPEENLAPDPGFEAPDEGGPGLAWGVDGQVYRVVDEAPLLQAAGASGSRTRTQVDTCSARRPSPLRKGLSTRSALGSGPRGSKARTAGQRSVWSGLMARDNTWAGRILPGSRAPILQWEQVSGHTGEVPEGRGPMSRVLLRAQGHDRGCLVGRCLGDAVLAPGGGRPSDRPFQGRDRGDDGRGQGGAEPGRSPA